ncbi:unnamed protein product [Hyaloperonospora brassicae]|uniref:RxLR effector protein n=1 Tax=Hyaloperonospora brassicae TaxID=162125 RepID=A0AAV0V2U0_HYABA|nr:unnamed protein product [Hyaloperonospora brassicae]
MQRQFLLVVALVILARSKAVANSAASDRLVRSSNATTHHSPLPSFTFDNLAAKGFRKEQSRRYYKDENEESAVFDTADEARTKPISPALSKLVSSKPSFGSIGDRAAKVVRRIADAKGQYRVLGVRKTVKKLPAAKAAIDRKIAVRAAKNKAAQVARAAEKKVAHGEKVGTSAMNPNLDRGKVVNVRYPSINRSKVERFNSKLGKEFATNPRNNKLKREGTSFDDAFWHGRLKSEKSHREYRDYLVKKWKAAQGQK